VADIRGIDLLPMPADCFVALIRQPRVAPTAIHIEREMSLNERPSRSPLTSIDSGEPANFFRGGGQRTEIPLHIAQRMECADRNPRPAACDGQEIARALAVPDEPEDACTSMLGCVILRSCMLGRKVAASTHEREIPRNASTARRSEEIATRQAKHVSHQR
jgi:hypothetical protein